jgi:hypothetical protein
MGVCASAFLSVHLPVYVNSSPLQNLTSFNIQVMKSAMQKLKAQEKA